MCDAKIYKTDYKMSARRLLTILIYYANFQRKNQICVPHFEFNFRLSLEKIFKEIRLI